MEKFDICGGVRGFRCRHRLRRWRQFNSKCDNFVCYGELFSKLYSDIANICMFCGGQRDGQL